MAGGIPGTTGRWWYLFAESEAIWFADTLSLHDDDGVTDMWYETVSRKPTNGVAYHLVRWRINCNIRVAGQTSVDAYDSDGNPLKQYSIAPHAPELHSIPPDSIAESLSLFACGKSEYWTNFGFRPIFREPYKFASDFYALIYMGLTDDQAAALARYARADNLPRIERTIDEVVPPALRAKVRISYGLPGKGAF